MPTPALVPDPNQREVLSLAATGGTIILTVRTCGERARCPIGGRPSARVHAR